MTPGDRHLVDFSELEMLVRRAVSNVTGTRQIGTPIIMGAIADIDRDLQLDEYKQRASQITQQVKEAHPSIELEPITQKGMDGVTIGFRIIQKSE